MGKVHVPTAYSEGELREDARRNNIAEVMKGINTRSGNAYLGFSDPYWPGSFAHILSPSEERNKSNA